MTPAVSVRDLTVRFGDFTAVRGISFDVAPGEIFGFLGANGAGKTTTIKVLCALETPTEGGVTVDGHRLTHDEPGSAHAIKASVGYMSQKFTLYDDLSVRDNLRFAANLRKIQKGEFEARAKELLDFIAFKEDDATLVANLSGGIKQQVSLVASLLHRPRVVFLDEPTAGVSPAARARFWSLIRDLSAGGTTVFVTTHYMDEAEQCGRIALMRTGDLIALDSPARLKAATFPHGVFEFSTDRPGRIDLAPLRRLGPTYLESYGAKVHAAFDRTVDAAALARAVEGSFRVAAIQPTLEDVFLRQVEARA